MMRAAFLGATFEEARDLVPKVAEFSELGSYLDLPMSSYSSGMVVRLSFSISTMLDPEILVMDEHVGAADIAFTRKATNRMRELADAAEIVVLATHDAALAEALCTHGIVLDHGRIVFEGSARETTGKYLSTYA
jgi:ABC-type polysaccharide/polyol phosphate transport system ATPase subunit